MRKVYGSLVALALALWGCSAHAAGAPYVCQITVTATTTVGASANTCALDPSRGSATIIETLASGSATFLTDITGDQNWGTSGYWIAEANLGSGSANAYDIFTGSATAASLYVSACSSCSVVLTVIQGAIPAASPGGVYYTCQVQLTTTSSLGGSGTVCPLDPGRGSATIIVTLSGSSGTINVGITGDFPGTSGYTTSNNWNNETNFYNTGSYRTASYYDVFTGTAQAVSLNVRACSSCTATMDVVQAAVPPGP